jgi:hypothetical protein
VSHFEFIMVMVSIIQGLGITLALRGISRLIRSPHREPVVLLWAVFLVFLYLQTWWAFWDLGAIGVWNIIQFLFVTLYVCTMYAMTELLLPIAATPETDWLAHFNSVRRWFFGMVVVLAVFGILLTWYLLGVPLVHPYRIIQLSIFSLGIVGWLTPSLVAHRLIAVLVILVLFSGQALFRLWPHLGS